MSRCLMTSGRHARFAFTTVELLTATAVSAVLMGLLVPAVQNARESARRLECQKNMSQIGQALLGHELSEGKLPPATESKDPGAVYPWTQPSWMTAILPRLDHQAVADKLDATKSVADAANRNYRSAKLQVMLCPSDREFNKKPFNGSRYGMGDDWARGNYAVNGGQANMSATTWDKVKYRGLMGCGRSVRKVPDGMSNTILLGELRAGFDEIDPRGSWAMGDSASSLWTVGSGHYNDENSSWAAYPGADCNGPNPANMFRMDQDDIVSCNDIWAKYSFEYVAATQVMGCWPGASYPGNRVNSQSAVRSLHYAGVNICMGDGSVRFVSDYVDTNGRIDQDPPRFSIWDRLLSSADGQPVPGNAF